MNSTAQRARDPQAVPSTERQPGLPPALKIVFRSTETRASNAARAALVVANVTPTGYRVGLFMADHARYATEADVRRNVVPGEIFTYWPQAKIAAEMGCSERQVRRGVRSMREAGALVVRRRVRPCEASYVWVQPVRSDVRSDGVGVRSESACVLSDVRSGVLSGVRSHTEPRTEPQKNHEGSSSRAREVCKICGHDWPAEYGTTCYQCPQPTASQRRDQEQQKRNEETGAEFERELLGGPCICGDAYRQSYGRLCVDCKGEPSPAQHDALREKDGGGVHTIGRVKMGGGGDNPSVPETETRQPPETRDQRPDITVAQDDGSPPDGGEGEDKPPPKADPIRPRAAVIRVHSDRQRQPRAARQAGRRSGRVAGDRPENDRGAGVRGRPARRVRC